MVVWTDVGALRLKQDTESGSLDKQDTPAKFYLFDSSFFTFLLGVATGNHHPLTFGLLPDRKHPFPCRITVLHLDLPKLPPSATVSKPTSQMLATVCYSFSFIPVDTIVTHHTFSCLYTPTSPFCSPFHPYHDGVALTRLKVYKLCFFPIKISTFLPSITQGRTYHQTKMGDCLVTPMLLGPQAEDLKYFFNIR